jgi:hypothetical protein
MPRQTQRGRDSITPNHSQMVSKEVGLSASRFGRFTPGKDPVRIVQEDSWATGSLYRLRYPCRPQE